MSAAPRKRKPASERRGSKDRDAARVRSASTGGAKRASAYDAQPEGRPSERGTAGSGPTPALRAGDATPGPALQPPDVSRGLKTHLPKREPPPNGVFVRLDWLRVTGNEDDLLPMMDFCRARFGNNGKSCNGGAFFKHGEKWSAGAMVSWGHAAKVVMLDLQGGLFSSITGSEGIELLRVLWNRGWKVTRIDGALDSIGQNRSIVDQARASCLADQLCRLRSFGERFRQRSKHDVSQKCVDLGRRDAEACVRIYDKGLEQGWEIANWWERIETEWKGEKALAVASALVSAGANWPTTLTERIVGAFDFRENNGRSELDKRPRVQWWGDLIDGLNPEPTPPTGRNANLQRWIEGLRHSYGPVLVAMKEASGWSWEEVIVWLLSGIKSNEESVVVKQWIDLTRLPVQPVA